MGRLGSVIAAVLWLVSGCGGDSIGGDSISDMSCGELRAGFEETVAATSKACDSRDDCGLAGVPNIMGLCECRPVVGPCEGVPVNSAAYLASRGPQLETEFRQRCTGCEYPNNFCICDCDAAGYDCVDGVCTVTGHHICNPPPPDAAPADAATPDAATPDAAPADAAPIDAPQPDAT